MASQLGSGGICISSYLESVDAKTTLFGLTVVWALYRTATYLRGLKSAGYIPGIRCLFEPFTFFGAITPESWWHPGLNFQWSQRLSLYGRYGLDTISIVPLLGGTARIWTGNLDVARQIIAGGPSSPWIKPQEYSKALLIWGMNLAAAEGGDLWRRHRRIMGPAFNNKTFNLVWNESLRVYKDMVASEGWLAKPVVDIPVIQTYTFKFALFIIASCGFGLPFTWDEPPSGKTGAMSIQEALRIVSEANFLRTSAPKWLWWLPIQKYRYIDNAYQTLDAFMRTQSMLRKAEIRQELFDNGGGGSDQSERNDVFSRLVLANESDAEKLPLDNQELIGNVFVLLFAGHETSGHTLAATLGFLGIYQEEQDIVYEQIMNVVGKDRDPTFEDYPALYKVLSAFYEALRLIPAGSVLIRETTKDTTLSVPKAIDKEGTREIFVAKGSVVNVDMVGIQYNPRYFPDPYAYKPSRWYEQESSSLPDTFTAFSVGPRACIGRKFATTEAVCWLVMLLRDFRVEVLLKPGETREQARERVLQAKMIMTLSVDPVPIRMIRRSGLESVHT